MSEERRRFDLDDIIYIIQFVLFYMTIIVGVLFIVLTATKKVYFPVLGVIAILVVAIIIEITFMIKFTKTSPDEETPRQTPVDLENEPITTDQKIEEEMEELQKRREWLKSL